MNDESIESIFEKLKDNARAAYSRGFSDGYDAAKEDSYYLGFDE